MLRDAGLLYGGRGELATPKLEFVTIRGFGIHFSQVAGSQSVKPLIEP
jgi:hypothetical protein